MVTRSEAASALGEPVTKGVLGKATVGAGLACVFYGPHLPLRNPNVATGDSVRVVVVKGSNAKQEYLAYKSTVRAVAVRGYGDQAFWDGFASLSVLKGDAYLRIAVAPYLKPPSEAGAEKLAKDILPKL